jgi:dTMP kinase
MLISISGIDGCGKTLQVQMLDDWMRKQDINAIVVKAYDDIAKATCRLLMDHWTDDTAIMFLFQALHAQQYTTAIQALKQGLYVIADRWDESYLAYHQNFGFLSSLEQTRTMLNNLAFHEKIPDIGFIITVKPEIARKRRESRGTIDRFEDRSDEYYSIVQETYLSIAQARGWLILDGTQTPKQIHEEIIRVLQEKICL